MPRNASGEYQKSSEMRMKMRNGLRGMAESRGQGAYHSTVHEMCLESVIRLTCGRFILSAAMTRPAARRSRPRRGVSREPRERSLVVWPTVALLQTKSLRSTSSCLATACLVFCFSKRLWRCRLGQVHGCGLSVWPKSGFHISEFAMVP